MPRGTRRSSFDLYCVEVAAARPNLDDGEPERLVVAAQGGDKAARDRLICYNLPLVIQAAKKYYRPGNYDFADVVAEGNLGVMAAIDDFNGEHGCKFCTYAWWRVRGKIQTFICKNQFTTAINQTYLRLAARWQAAEGAEIAAGGPVSSQRVAARAEIGESNVATTLRAVRAMTAVRCPIDANGIGTDRGITFSLVDDAVGDHTSDGIDEEESRRLQAALERLAQGDWRDQRKLSILSARFGLDGRVPLPLRKIGVSLEGKISYERVRQIEKKTLDWLRAVIGASNGTKD